MEPLNSVDKYAVAAIGRGHVVGHLKKGTSRKFAQTISYFLKCDENNRRWAEVTGKRCNWVMEKECKSLVATLRRKENLYWYTKMSFTKIIKIYCQNFDKIEFFIKLLLRVRSNGRKYSLGKQ